MRILIASDHAGFELKERLGPFLRELGHEVNDFGSEKFDPRDDYPDFVAPLAREISASGRAGDVRGIVLGGSGQGEAMVANRFRGVRAVVFNGQYRPTDGHTVPDEIILSREHNDANVLALGARFLSEGEAKEAVKRWLETPFGGEERHARRLKKIEQLVSSK